VDLLVLQSATDLTIARYTIARRILGPLAQENDWSI
jgi:hypothetical protein